MAEQRDVTKLPQWAQRKIEVLTRDLAYWRDRHLAGPDVSDTFVGFAQEAKPLGMAPRIRFVVGEDPHWDYIDVRREGDHVVIHGNRNIQVLPRAANSANVGLMDR